MAPGAACCEGPGYPSPLAAMAGPRETLLYVPAIIPDQQSRPDYLATVDVDPDSATYSQVIHRLPMPNVGDELHHSGWNACSSCHSDSSKQRNHLILPAMGSGRVYSVDVSDAREPRLHKTAEPADIADKTGLAYPHTSHCLGNGDIMISTMGRPDGSKAGNFLLLDQDLNVKGKWAQEDTAFGYDFWYQPRHNILISSEFGTPVEFFKGFNPALVPNHYGSKLYVWDWQQHSLKQTIELGGDGLIPLELRFLHNPDSTQAFVGAALSSNVIGISVGEGGEVSTHVAIKQPWLKVQGWALPELPPLITDILISLDDKYLFFSNWLRGDVVQYDISDPSKPVFKSRVWLGGSFAKGGGVTADKEGLAELGLSEEPEAPVVKGVKLRGGPQMLQLSLDGKRLYVTNSLLTPWDKQFYPDMYSNGSHLVLVDVDPERGMTLNNDFIVDFGQEPGGPVLAHECRYPGGDCSSDIWL